MCGARVHELCSRTTRKIETDHTAWDCHQHRDILQVLHEFYFDYFGNDPVLQACCKAQLTNNWLFTDGMSYTLHGTRVSGDSDTSLGNSLAHVVINWHIARQSGVQIDQMVKGDDAIIGIYGDGHFNLDLYKEQFGFEVKPIMRDSDDQIEFASSYSMEIDTAQGPAYKMFRLPKKIIERTPYAIGQFNGRNASKRFNAKVLCELVCNTGCPVIYALCTHWYRGTANADLRHLTRDERYRYEANGPNTSMCTISPNTRIQFERRFGISVTEQEECENYLRLLLPGESPDHPVLSRLV